MARAKKTDPEPLAEANFAPAPGTEKVSEPVSSRKTPFAKEIVEAIEKRGITREAAQLLAANPSWGQELDEIGAVRIILGLLEVQEFALADLRKFGDIESGLTKCQEAWDARKRKPIPYSYKTDASGKRLPIPLEEGLSVLMGSQKKVLRLPRFRDWLCDDYKKRLRAEIAALQEEEDFPIRTENLPHLIEKLTEQSDLLKDPREVYIKVDSQIIEMQEHGIPAEVFDRALHEFSDWWERAKSESKSAAGTAGQKKKRQAQGKSG